MVPVPERPLVPRVGGSLGVLDWSVHFDATAASARSRRGARAGGSPVGPHAGAGARFSGSKRAARSFARWWSRRCRRNGRRGAGSKEVGPGFSGSNGGEVSERQTAHLYNPAKRWVKQKCCQLLAGGAGEPRPAVARVHPTRKTK